MLKILKELIFSAKLSSIKYFSARCESDVKLNGKTIIITGCNTGIGKELAKNFYKRGARILMACRDLKKAQQAKNDIEQDCVSSSNKGELIIKHLDLNNLESTRQSAEEFLKTESKIHMLVNNAGIFMSDVRHTTDGFEKHFAVNHLAPFLFTLLLIPKILAAGSGKIINISSVAHRFVSDIDFSDLDFSKSGYGHTIAYGQSKLANILFAKELARRFTEINADVKTYSLHPGSINTDICKNINTLLPSIFRPIYEFIANLFKPLFLKTVNQGIQTILHCSLTEEANKETGLYYEECEVREPSDTAKNDKLARRLWEESWKLTRLEEDYNPFVRNK